MQQLNLENQELDRQDFLYRTKEKREKQQALIAAKREREELMWAEKHKLQQQEAEKRLQKLNM